MAAYEQALRAAAQLRFFGKHGLGFMVRFFVEAHVRGQMKHLIAAYCVVEPGFDSHRVEWLSQSRDQLDRTATALRNLGDSFAALSPLALVVVLLPFVPADRLDDPWGPLILVLAAVFSYMALYGLHKRGKKTILDGVPSAERTGGIDQLEDALFDLLPLRKRWEFADAVITLVCATCLTIPGLVFLLRSRDPDSADVRFGAILLVIGVALVPYYAFSRWWLKPKPSPRRR